MVLIHKHFSLRKQFYFEVQMCPTVKLDVFSTLFSSKFLHSNLKKQASYTKLFSYSSFHPINCLIIIRAVSNFIIFYKLQGIKYGVEIDMSFIHLCRYNRVY